MAGALTRYAQLSRDFHGSRAILNAVERLIGSAPTEREKIVRDLGIAQGQLRDYEARLGAGFAHTGYLNELTGLRNQLEAALSSTTQQVSDAPVWQWTRSSSTSRRSKPPTPWKPRRSAPPHARRQPSKRRSPRAFASGERMEPPPQLETTPPPVSPAMTAPLPPTAPEPPPSLFQDKGERRSPATPARKRPVRPPHRYASRQLSLLQSEGVPRSPAPSSQDRPNSGSLPAS